MHAREHAHTYVNIYISVAHSRFTVSPQSLYSLRCGYVNGVDKNVHFCLQLVVQLLGVVPTAACFLFVTHSFTTLGVHCVVLLSRIIYIGFPSLIRTLPNSVTYSFGYGSLTPP